MTVKVPIERKNILVLGGAGFLGSHVCEFLLKRGDNVICLDNFASSDVENIKMMLEFPNFEFIRHDVIEDIDLESLPELKKFHFQAQGLQEVYNFACPTSAQDYSKLPVETALANSVGVVKSLEMARKYNARYLLASSSAVYGSASGQMDMINESYLGSVNIIGPRACYNEGKRFAETLVTTYKDYYKMDVRVARIFTTYGPRMMLMSGRHVPDFIYNALKGQPLTIQGDDKTGSSLCYVKDMVEGIVALMHSHFSDPVNLGGDRYFTYKEVAEQIKSATNTATEITFADPLPHSHRQLLPDISLAKEKLGWFPLIGLEQGIGETIAYARSNIMLKSGLQWNREEKA